MAALVWDQAGTRFYETGIDRGVLYQSNGKGIAWNGLTSVTETFSKSVESVYYDGLKINDLVKLGDFSATLNAITYPEEFLEYEGYGKVRMGFNLGNQEVLRFGLSYRTSVGNDLTKEAGYKIHILYNLTAVPSEKAYNTISEDAEFTEFSWEVSSVPNATTGYRPSAHVILDSRYLGSEMMESIESILYGTSLIDPRLPSQNELIAFVHDFFIMHITDNGNGTWTATTNTGFDSLITVNVDGTFTITEANAIYIDSQKYEITDTLD